MGGCLWTKMMLMVVVMMIFGGAAVSVGAKFEDLYQPSWANDHLISQGDLIHLKLDNLSGAGFQSKSKYMFGKVSLQMKLVQGDSAGTVTAFYMSSDGPNHNEFDYEFLGNVTGEPYLVQTNLYVNGTGNREQRMNLWFDPTTDFHTYSIHWSPRSVVFMVDETPIRTHTNLEHRGIAFPKDQAMGVYSSIWNADDWATQGGRVKTDWSHAPFVVSYKGFEINNCADTDGCSDTVSELNLHQSHQLMWVKAKHMVYDYCSDTSRFPTTPLECLHHRH